jgi:hypothetical protein
MFMEVVDRETGAEFRLDLTDALSADLERHQRECPHPDKQIRKTIVSGGAVHFRYQCQICGDLIGQAIGKGLVPEHCLSVDERLREGYRRRRERERDDIVQRYVQKQKAEGSAWREKYAAHLRTPEWRGIRAKVLKRSGGVCEGCGQNRPTQVHHLTYDHIFNEFLFELVAVCDHCHQRLHDEHGQAADEWQDGFPCEGCRFQGEKDNRRWCRVFDFLAIEALSLNGQCGPTHAGFEPMK